MQYIVYLERGTEAATYRITSQLLVSFKNKNGGRFVFVFVLVLCFWGLFCSFVYLVGGFVGGFVFSFFLFLFKHTSAIWRV